MQVDEIIKTLTSKKITSFHQWLTADFELFVAFCGLSIGEKNETVLHLSRLRWKLDIKKGNAAGVATLLRSISKDEFITAMAANGVHTQSDISKYKHFISCLQSGIGSTYRMALKKDQKSLKGDIPKEVLKKSPEAIAAAIIKTRNSGMTLTSVVLALDDIEKSTKIFYLVAEHQIQNKSGIQQTKKAVWRRLKVQMDAAVLDPYVYLVDQVEIAIKKGRGFSYLFSMIPVLILRKRKELTVYYGLRNNYLARTQKDGGGARGWTTEHQRWSKDQWAIFLEKFQIEYSDLGRFKGLEDLLASRCILHILYPEASSFKWLPDIKTIEKSKSRKPPRRIAS